MAKLTAKQENGKGGRPSKHVEAYNDLAYKYCLLGATNETLAEYFNVVKSTIDLWIKDIPEFSGSVKRGRHVADAEIAHSLYHRAKGYSHKDTHISNYQGDITETEITKHYPPDTAAAFIWLKNRAGWKDKSEQDITLNGDLATRMEKARKRAAKDPKE